MSGSTVSVPGTLWHVTITVNGEPTSAGRLRSGLANLEMAHPFGLSARYALDTVEIRYWDEGQDCRSIARNALSLWDDHRKSLGLPVWPVVGLEILNRATFRRRWPTGSDHKNRMAPGVRPM